jgi:acylphosphatase
MMQPDDRARLEVSVRGAVQGVGYRYFVLRVAAGLDITGWVANEPDGSVRCVAEGRRPTLERLAAALREGPPAARVDDVRVTWAPATGSFTTFGVRARGHTGN